MLFLNFFSSTSVLLIVEVSKKNIYLDKTGLKKLNFHMFSPYFC